MSARRPARPDTVRIGSLDYSVQHDAEAILGAEEELQKRLYGMSEAATQRIILRPGMAPGFTRQIMLHEIIHQLFDDSGDIGLSNDTEELVCQALQAPLLGVLKDNPDLVRWLVGED